MTTNRTKKDTCIALLIWGTIIGLFALILATSPIEEQRGSQPENTAAKLLLVRLWMGGFKK